MLDVIHPNHLDLLDTLTQINWEYLAQFGGGSQDVMGNLGRGFNNFIRSGQLVALIIGLVAGYLFRSVTSG
ncbi:MAG: hypothetical protein HC919_05855 [Oscillatoriales cyanobacterium SM2_2_1]|nr:hypothetical protein [Oscillatoriales cyanobacterium SM2_2_1]